MLSGQPLGYLVGVFDYQVPEPVEEFDPPGYGHRPPLLEGCPGRGDRRVDLLNGGEVHLSGLLSCRGVEHGSRTTGGGSGGHPVD